MTLSRAYHVVILMLAVCASATSAEPSLFELTGPTMGTRYSVKVITQDQASAEELQAIIDARLVEINNLMSTYIADSELSRFNTSGSTEPMEISPETAKVIAAAMELARDSSGAFDPTVGPAVDIWGFGPKGKRQRPPTDDEVQAARERVGYKKLEVDENALTIRRTESGVEVNLSAIAKGYGVDAVCAVVEAAGIENYMVEIGGEIRVRGTKPSGKAWQLGIERPDDQGRAVIHVLSLTDGALATSGDYRNFFEFEGQRYSHTINPQTGRPVTHSLATVSVFAGDCMMADGLATTLLVLGPEAGYDWAEERNIAAHFVERDGDQFRERSTSDWPAQFAGGEKGASSEEKEGQTMIVYIAAAVAFGLAVTGMAIGVILSNRRIRGTCGGINNRSDAQGNTVCGLCSNPAPDCRGEPDAESRELANH